MSRIAEIHPDDATGELLDAYRRIAGKRGKVVCQTVAPASYPVYIPNV